MAHIGVNGTMLANSHGSFREEQRAHDGYLRSHLTLRTRHCAHDCAGQLSALSAGWPVPCWPTDCAEAGDRK